MLTHRSLYVPPLPQAYFQPAAVASVALPRYMLTCSGHSVKWMTQGKARVYEHLLCIGDSTVLLADDTCPGPSLCRCDLEDLRSLLKLTSNMAFLAELRLRPVMDVLEARLREELGCGEDALVHQLISLDEIQLLARDAERAGHPGLAVECTQILHQWMERTS